MLLAKKDVKFVAETIPTGETFSMLQELAKELSSSLDYLARFPSAMTPRRRCCSTRHLCLRTRASWSPSTAISTCWTWPWRRPVQETVLDGLHQGRKDLTIFELDGVKLGLGIGYDLWQARDDRFDTDLVRSMRVDYNVFLLFIFGPIHKDLLRDY